MDSGLIQAVDEYVATHEGIDFNSRDVVQALPMFKPVALRGRLHWFVTTGRLVTHRSPGVAFLIYSTTRLREGAQRADFVCSAELIEVMRRLGHQEKMSIAVPVAMSEVAWVQAIIERCRARC